MASRLSPFAPLVFLASTGCLGEDAASLLVPTNPFSSTPVVQAPTKVAHAPASEEAATRVSLLGQKVLLANPELGLRPAILTIGDPRPEIFHRGMAELIVTEGLVKRCTSEGQLAAVLCHELGEMAAEREVMTGPLMAKAERELPIRMDLGSDNGGSRGSADLTYLAELAPYEKQRQRSREPQQPPNPQVIARTLLRKSGFKAADMDAATPLLQEADDNITWERQLTTQKQTTWTQRSGD